ncbi:MAG: hypothetical protein LBU79_06220 [Planctomycetota bacterium]|nr:hypothetical protein [Planctomycetota bacterium]
MPDNSNNFRATRVSRRTQVIRKAATDDALRHGVTKSFTPEGTATAKPEEQRSARTLLPQSASEKLRSGSVTIKKTKVVSGRFISQREGLRTSIRLRPGDTILRKQGGQTLILHRRQPRFTLKTQVLTAYALGYVVVFALYFAFLLGGTWELDPQDYLTRSFPGHQGNTAHALRRAALDAMRGSRTPAEVRFAEEFTFYNQAKDLIKIEAGQRLTLLNGAELGEAILADQLLEEKSRIFKEPFLLLKEYWLAAIDWPYWLMLYNLVGFYLLGIILLYRPIMDHLGTQGKKTMAAVETARQARREAANIREKARAQKEALDTKEREQTAKLAEEMAEWQQTAVLAAEKKASSIISGLSGIVAVETAMTLSRLKNTTATAACREAETILASVTRISDHNRAIDQLIANLSES